MILSYVCLWPISAIRTWNQQITTSRWSMRAIGQQTHSYVSAPTVPMEAPKEKPPEGGFIECQLKKLLNQIQKLYVVIDIHK